jgi:hypothetical protein
MNIETWKNGVLLNTQVVPDIVPQQITRYQLQKALQAIGKLTAFKTFASNVARTPDELIDWAEKQVWSRNDPLILAAATAGGVTAPQLDALFIAASLIG